MRSRLIRGVKLFMRKFDFMFGAMLGECLLRHSDNLSQALRSPQVSAAEGQKMSALTITFKTSETRNDTAFGLFGETLIGCRNLDTFSKPTYVEQLAS